jgi:hypothetical protein
MIVIVQTSHSQFEVKGKDKADVERQLHKLTIPCRVLTRELEERIKRPIHKMKMEAQHE